MTFLVSVMLHTQKANNGGYGHAKRDSQSNADLSLKMQDHQKMTADWVSMQKGLRMKWWQQRDSRCYW